MDHEKAIRAAKLTLGGILEKRRAKTAVERADGQIAPSKYMPGVPRQVHAYGGRASEKSDIWWHGSPSGDLRGGTSGLHLGTKEAALDALRARIGVPADGSMWDGTKSYGSTLLAGKNTLNKMGKYLITGHNVNAPDEDYYPHQHPRWFPTVGAGVPVDPEWRPFLKPFKIVGPMTNSPYSPHGDGRANSMMKASLTKGNAKNGYYYTNDAEDSGSISAVVPNGSHVVPLGEEPKQGYANGGYVPSAALPVGRLAVAGALPTQRQPGLLDALSSLSSVGNSATEIAKLVSPKEKEAPKPHADRVEAKSEGLTPEATSAMEALRKGWAGQDFGIVSGYRDPEHNERVGGAKDSQHTHGNAYDVNTTGWSPEDKLALADAAWNAGFRGFGFYDNNMHFDVGGERAWGPSYSRDSIPEWAQGWASQRYGYADGGPAGMGDNGGPPLSEPPVDLGQAREQKQMQTFHSGLMDDIHTRMTHAMEAHQKAVDAGVFDGYEVGDTLQGSAHPMRITGRYMQAWKPTTMALRSFERMNTKPTIIEHEGKQYIPMLRYRTGKEGVDGFQEGSAYLDGVRAAGYQKMGGLRAVKAAGGAAMFQDIHPDLQDEQGKPMDLYHGTPGEGFSEFKDENLGKRDTGFYGRGHYLTPDQGSAEEYADPNQMGSGTVMGPLHAALKNPYVWDMSNETKAYSTLKDLHSMGIMRDRNTRMNPWDNLKSHEINTFMEHMGKRGHDGVIVKQPNWQDGEGSSVSEIVVFKPSAIKHKDAKSFDPNDPNIYHARGGVAK
jgi:hypothetical protein